MKEIVLADGSGILCQLVSTPRNSVLTKLSLQVRELFHVVSVYFGDRSQKYTASPRNLTEEATIEKKALEVQEEQWIQIIAAAKQSGQPIKVWCTEHSVPMSSFYTQFKLEGNNEY